MFPGIPHVVLTVARAKLILKRVLKQSHDVPPVVLLLETIDV